MRCSCTFVPESISLIVALIFLLPSVRPSQVLMTSPPLLLCFQLAQLHSFYTTLVAKAIGQGAHLSSALRSCRDMASRVFFEQLKGKGDKLLKAPPSPPRDLSPPPQVCDGRQHLWGYDGHQESLTIASLMSDRYQRPFISCWRSSLPMKPLSRPPPQAQAH